MKDVLPYLLKYKKMVCVAILFLFSQAIFTLQMPNIMSSIVNNGIQNSGIFESAPQVISEDALQMIQLFMDETGKTTVNNAYKQIDENNLEDYSKDYSNIKTDDFFKQNISNDIKKELELIFSNASYAMVQAISSDEIKSKTDDEIVQTDVNSLLNLMPIFKQTQNLQTYVQQASLTPSKITNSTGIIMAKAFYVQIGADTNAIQMNYILITGFKMLLVCFAIIISAISANFFQSKLAAGISRDLRKDVFTKISHFTSAEMDKFSTASLIIRTTNDVSQVQSLLTSIRTIVYAPLLAIGGLIMALTTSVSMIWVLGLVIIFLVGIVSTIFRLAVPKYKIMQNLVDKLNLVSREHLSGMLVVRAFSTQKFEENRFETANNNLTKNTLYVNRLMATMAPSMTFMQNAIMLLIVWVGSDLVAQSTLQVGDIMAFMQYTMNVIMGFVSMSHIFTLVPRAAVSVGRVTEVLNTDISIKDAPQTKKIDASNGVDITFKNVDFNYAGAEKNVLSDISFTAKAGQTTAFIGSTGSGKSTLVNLVPRFYDINSGSILINGVDIKDVSQKDLRSIIGYVPQKGILLTGDIDSNLRYADENISDEDLKIATDIAQATSFINELEDGYDTYISQGGTNVSGGQRQRLCIARALVKKAPIYIFDDTFSALDFKTDATLRKELKPYTKNSTVLIVAQRVSTIMYAEQIVVLDEGRVVGTGTHDELLKTCKTYQEIASSQLAKEEL